MNQILYNLIHHIQSKRGTIRGMHYQSFPYEETKIVRCTRGKVFDVIIDLRENSPTYKRWFGEILSLDNHKMMYVPRGFGHGLQTLEDDSEIFYNVSQIYAPEYEKGVRWDDPAIGIKWPLPVTEISEKDTKYDLF